MKLVAIALALTLMMGSINAQQYRPTHVVIVFDTSKSFWSNLHIAHAVTERLLKELYFILPGHPDDKLSFIALNVTPTIVTELSGLELRRKVARKFVEAFGKPDPRLGTDVVGAMELADLAFSRHRDAIKFLFIFSDMQVDPARTPDGRIFHFRQLTEFNWERLKDVNIWFFFCPPQMELWLKKNISTLQRAYFFSPPPMTDGVLEKANLEAFVNRISSRFQNEVVKQLKPLSKDSDAKGFGFLWLILAALAFMGILLGLFAYLVRRGGEID